MEVQPQTFSPLHDRSILITGGTGSFGTAFVRRALNDGARRVVVYSRDELKQAAMCAAFPDSRMRFFIGDVRDPDRLALAMRDVDIVIHAAAMKRIETCEANPTEAIATNVIGTQNVALAAIKAGVERAVFLSTDKAPHAQTLYGGTKFCAERLWIQSNVFAAGGPTRLSATRYGNVLGSRGSVLDLFQAQAAAGESLSVTHPLCSRFWMHLDDAVELVLTALHEMRGGEIFVPKAPSAPVTTLAAAVHPAGNYYVTGLRPGERLHETLISCDEAHTTYETTTHFVIEPEARPWSDVPHVPRYARVAPEFTYRSDTNPEQMDAEQLRGFIGC